MAMAGSALFIWMSINTEIIDNMNQQDCRNSKNAVGDGAGDGAEKTVDAVQSLYIWLTIILGLSFIGIVKGIRGITTGRDVYDVKQIFPVIYIAGTIIAIFIAAFSIRLNPIVENMTTDYQRITSNGANGDILKANTMISKILIVLTVVPSIAMIGILHKGYELLEKHSDKGTAKGQDMIGPMNRYTHDDDGYDDDDGDFDLQ